MKESSAEEEEETILVGNKLAPIVSRRYLLYQSPCAMAAATGMHFLSILIYNRSVL